MDKASKNDFGMRIISIVCAVGLWLYVVYAENPIVEYWVYGVPLQSSALGSIDDKGLVIMSGEIIKTVDIKLKGRRRFLGELTNDDITASVDFSNVSAAGTYVLPLNVEIKTHDIEVIEKKPMQIHLTTDKLITVTKEISPVLVGNMPRGFAINGVPECEPAYIEVSGPSVVVEAVSIFTDGIDIKDAKEPFGGYRDVIVKDAEGNDVADKVTLSHHGTNFTVAVDMIKDLPIELDLVDAEDDYEVEYSFPVRNARVKGAPDVVADIEAIKTVPFTVSREYSNEVVTLELQPLPEGVTLYETANVVTVVVNAKVLIPSPSPDVEDVITPIQTPSPVATPSVHMPQTAPTTTP